MKLKHIDNSFYLLTVAQAKALCMERTLPAHGYTRKADPAALDRVQLVHGDKILRGEAVKADQASVQHTRLNGETVWALHLYFGPRF